MPAAEKLVVPGELAEEPGCRPGNSLDATIEAGTIILSPSPKAQYRGAIIDDPITGLPVVDFGPDAPSLTHEAVQPMLADFP